MNQKIYHDDVIKLIDDLLEALEKSEKGEHNPYVLVHLQQKAIGARKWLSNPGLVVIRQLDEEEQE